MEVVIIAFLTQKEFEDLGFDTVDKFDNLESVQVTQLTFIVAIATITSLLKKN